MGDKWKKVKGQEGYEKTGKKRYKKSKSEAKRS